MQQDLLGPIIDRAVANARVIRGAPESVALAGIIAFAVSYIVFQVQDPKLDLDHKKITFPTVNSSTILGSNKSYEFRNCKLACGSTQLYNMVSNGVGYDYSSPLTCKVVGNR